MMAICPCSNMAVKFWSVPFFFKDFNYLFLERGKGQEKERERNTDQVPLAHPPNGDLACNPAMCPDWESNG